ncbi:MAG: FAD:protein FMN transferase [Bacteroidota bacterium]
MPETYHFQQHAMASLFEGWLVGEDIEHLRAVGNVIQAEFLRVEELLSRHDPVASLARLNREATRGWVQVERELLAVLQDALHWFGVTGGAFDISVGTMGKTMQLQEALALDPKTSRVRYLHPNLSLDFGGYGKGYALDCAADLLQTYQIHHALLHGGRSSFWATGKRADKSPWRIRLPQAVFSHADQLSEPLQGGLSFSAVDSSPQSTELFHSPPSSAHQVQMSVVWAETALKAEVLSTAILATDPASLEAVIPNFSSIKKVISYSPII